MQNTGCTEQRERQNPEGEKKKTYMVQIKLRSVKYCTVKIKEKMSSWRYKKSKINKEDRPGGQKRVSRTVKRKPDTVVTTTVCRYTIILAALERKAFSVKKVLKIINST